MHIDGQKALDILFYYILQMWYDFSEHILIYLSLLPMHLKYVVIVNFL